MATERHAVKCLDCDVTLVPNGAWQKCKCEHLYIDDSPDSFQRIGFLDEERVELIEPEEKSADSRSQTRRKKVQRSGDKWTESGTFE